MAVASRGASTLNPNAPLFIPLAYQLVEDFSQEWWNLVKSSPWFRDYWLRERFDSTEDTDLLSDLVSDGVFGQEDGDEFAELESELEESLVECSVLDERVIDSKGNGNDQNEKKELLALKNQGGRPMKLKYEKHVEKPPQIVNVKTSPRRIQQPR